MDRLRSPLPNWWAHPIHPGTWLDRGIEEEGVPFLQLNWYIYFLLPWVTTHLLHTLTGTNTSSSLGSQALMCRTKIPPSLPVLCLTDTSFGICDNPMGLYLCISPLISYGHSFSGKQRPTWLDLALLYFLSGKSERRWCFGENLAVTPMHIFLTVTLMAQQSHSPTPLAQS